MIVNFLNTGFHDSSKEQLVVRICLEISKILALPEIVEVQFQKFDNGIWGGTHLDWKIKNRISLSCDLSIHEIPIVLVHELIHVYQINSGILRVDKNNQVYWQGIIYNTNNLSYNEYQQLPWERDVSYRLKKILETVINS